MIKDYVFTLLLQVNNLQFSIRMRGGHHLREINYNRMIVFVYHYVELVKITMDDTAVAETHNKVH